MSKNLRFFSQPLYALLLFAGSTGLAQTKISSFSPASGPAGTQVTITGSGFNASPAGNLVYFGAVRAAVSTASATIVTVTVPAGATYQPVSVVNTANYQTAYAAAPFIITFNNPYRPALSNSFYKPRIDFATGSTALATAPFFVTSGDLNGDGKAEIVAVNATARTVSIMRNAAAYGNLTATSFNAPLQLAVGNDPRAAAIGDVNADGKPDIVVVNSADETLSVLINTSTTASTGDISFSPRVDFQVGSNPLSVAIQDVNGDGKPDVVVANHGSNTLSVLRNIFQHDATGTDFFAAKVDFPAGNAPRSVVVTDLDGDKKVDLAVVNEQAAGTVSVLRNTITTTTIDAAAFAGPVGFATGESPSAVAAGDADGDGKTDLVVANFGSSTVSVLRNTGAQGSINASSFAAKIDYNTGSQPFAVATGDADGDGKPDIIAANPAADKLTLLKNTATSGTLTASSFAAATVFATDAYPVSVAIGDLDGDGEPELMVANAATNDVSILAFYPPGAPVITAFSPASGAAGTTVTITGTGFNPVAARNTVFFGVKKATVVSGTTSSLIVTVPVGATYQPVSLLNDLSSLAAYSARPFVITFKNPFGNGIPSNFYQYRVDFNVAANATYGVAFSDLDGDGKTDLLAVNENANTLSVLSENGSGGIYSTSFQTKTTFPLATGPRMVAVHDMDGDGAPDVVALSPAVNYIGVLRNTRATPTIRSASLAAAGGVDLANHISSFAIGDLDRDGRPDLVVTNQYLGTISVLRNITPMGSATVLFAYRVDFAAGDNPRAVAVSDVDGDGKAEILVTNERSNNVSVYRNLSAAGIIDSSSFAVKVDFAAGMSPNSIVAGDVDGDGKTDIVVSNYGSNNVSVLRNTAAMGAITPSSFAARVDFATDTNPFSLAIGDLDGDGKADLVTANSTANTFSVLRNTSTAGSITTSSFATKLDLIAAGYPVDVTVGDLDGDSIPEITAANTVSGNISVWKIGTPAVISNPGTPGTPSSSDSVLTVQLYPNPTKGVATLLLSGIKESVVNLDIFSDNGTVIEKRTIPTTGRTTIQLLNLRNKAAGVYYVKITTTSGVRVEKLVVQR